MSLIPDCHPNPGWRVVWVRQKDPGNTICNLGADPEGKVVGHRPVFVSSRFALALPMGSGCGGLPSLLPLLPFVPIQLCSGVASTWLLCCQPLVNPSRQWPGGDGADTACSGAVVNHHDRLLSYLTSFLSQTLSPSVYFCCRFIRHTVKCPFSSANCHHACFMNKLIH